MAAPQTPVGPDLRSILEQDRLAVIETLELSRKLVIEVRTSHFWTQHSLDSFVQLENIGQNMRAMIEALAPHFSEGKRIFNRPEAAKLWKTGAALMAAVPPLRAKFAEQLDKRRRQRIMGQTYEELPEVTAEDVEQGVVAYAGRQGALMTLWEDLKHLIASLPEGLTPAAVKSDAAPSANGAHAEAKDGASASDIAAPPPPEVAEEQKTASETEEQG